MTKKYRLRNGVTVVCERMDSVRSVAVGVWAGAGAQNEPRGICGVSHFIEHMLFKGTRRRTARRIAEEIDYIGGHINAFTAKDCTCFYTNTLECHLNIAIDVLADILQHSKIAKADVDLERNVILEEINMYEDSPDELVHDLLTEGVWSGCPLGNPILGTKETLARIGKTEMKEYISHKYTPENIVISVSGRFDEDGLMKALDKGFGGLGKNKAKLEADGDISVVSDVGDAAVYMADAYLREKDIEQINLCVGFSGVELGNDDLYPLNLINLVLGGGMSSILFQKIREELGLAYSIFSYISAYINAGLFAIYAGMQAEQAPRALDMIFAELGGFIKTGMSDELLKRSKEQFKGSYYMGLDSPNARMSAIGKAQLLLGYFKTPEETVEKIEAVSVDDVNRVINRIFIPENLAISAVGRVGNGFDNIARDALNRRRTAGF